MKLIIVRGPSGAGKTTTARDLVNRQEADVMISADDFL